MERRVSGRAIRIAGRCEGARREKAGCVWVTYRSDEEMGGERVKRKERAEGLKKQGEAEEAAGQTRAKNALAT